MASETPIKHVGSWPVVTLSEITTKIGSGATPKGGADTYLPTRARFALVRSQNVFDRRFGHDGLAYISDDQAEGLRGVHLRSLDLLLNITGDGITFGRACLAPDDILPACVNQHVSIIRVDQQRADPGFVLAFLTHPNVKAYIRSFSAGGSRRAVTKGHIESFRLPLPPLPEQHAIAHILSTLDDKIELNRRMSETLEAMARALFKSWFVDFDPVRAKAEGSDTCLPPAMASLFPDAFSKHPDLGEIPEGWRPSPLSTMAELNPECWSKNAAPASVKYIDLANTKWGGITSIAEYSWREAPSRARRILRPGDTMVGTVRPGNGSYALVVEKGLTGSTGFAVLRPRMLRFRSFIYFAATSPDNIDRLSRLADGAAYPAVRPETVASTRVVADSGQVIDLFSLVVDPILGRIAAAEQESRTLAALRDALLPKLTSGELRVEDAEKFIRNAVG